MAGVLASLKAHPLMRGIPPAKVKALSRHATWETFAAGHAIICEGRPADRVFLIVSGDLQVQIRVPARPPLTIETLHGGDVLGWSWLVEPHLWTFDALAASDVTALTLRAEALEDAFTKDPELGYLLLRRMVAIMAQRLQGARVQMLDLYGPEGARVP